MVIGENRKFTAALIQPDFEFIRKWAKRKKLNLVSREDITASAEVKDRMWEEIQKYNKRFGHIEQVKKAALVQDLWSVESGELTPTLKVKREFVGNKYNDLIEKIYSDISDNHIL